MAERNDDLYSTLMDISDTIREKALDLTLNVNDESEESRDLLDRGKALQKAMRKKGKPTIKEASRKDDIEVGIASSAGR
uniref:Uncharacterized protein n=1 Tax=Amphimedon queenslandica TaxID=400682 RepID=A0A1X7SIS6_AMPQE